MTEQQPLPEADEVEPVAIVGMACRVPGARTIEQFWHNQANGIESITRFDRAELLAAGVPEHVLADPDLVPAWGYLPDADRFDAAFFGYNTGEAETMDPQQRVFCETAWQAVENSGHTSRSLGDSVGVFAGTFMNKYLIENLTTNARFQRSPMAPLARMFNDKDFLATRIAYLLDLTGPAYTVQTACSTSLVATHLGCQSLLSYECDAALVGGVTINLPLKSAYPVADGGLFSADGHCRPFDAHAAGTVPGNGAVVLVLRRLSDALADNDHVYAVIRGSAVNNDGSMKAGFAAPSVDGQAHAISAALAVAGVDPATIGYVETHGTATQVGDPIEVAALTQAFGGAGHCALGSVKANIGHLDAAAGAAGLLRAVLSIHNGQIPPQVNFTEPNPELRLHDTPFHVPTRLLDWRPAAGPRRAGVSSFGVGGTNAHLVVEQAPPAQRSGEPARAWQLLPVSARDAKAADAATGRLAEHLEQSGMDTALPDVAFTLQQGRQSFGIRRFVVSTDVRDAARALRDPGRLVTRTTAPDGAHSVAFAFPGAGTQHPDMGLDIYRSEPVFRAEVDTCAELLRPRLGFDLRRLLFPSAFTPLPDQGSTPGTVTMGRRHGPGVVPALFTVEYAMARQLMSWGVRPAAMIGHSLGEYVAACLSGVFTLAGALEITLARGELFAAMPPGRMMVVQLPEDEVRALLPERISVSAVNAPDLTVVAGPDDDIAALLTTLRAEGVDCRKVSVPVASHSWMVEAFLDEFVAKVKAVPLSTPEIPFVSSVTGTWITDRDATDPDYWARHLREPVRFADGVREVLGAPRRVLLEVGPGRSLSALAAGQRLAPAPITVPTMGLPRDQLPDLAHLVGAVGRLWQAGVEVDWAALHGAARPARTPLPGYPFDGARYWVPPGRTGIGEPAPEEPQESTAAEVPDGSSPPRTERERQVARIWCDLLGRDRVDIDEDFFDLGAHSLMVTQVTRELRRMGATDLTARDVLRASTVAEMAALVDRALGVESAVPVSAGPDLAAEVVLDEDITALGLPAPADGPPRTVLLTGATGFVGAFLGAELLERTDLTVVCLVRGVDEQHALERLRGVWSGYGLARVESSRLTVLVGDLARPRLGLSDSDFDELATRIDAIYHCGAWVNFVRPYRALRATNVLGTQEILRLATRVKLKPVHHISTLAVLAAEMLGGTERIGENDPLPPPIGHDTAYSQSKWVAEGLIGIARQRGIPVSVYRAGGVLPDSRSGAANTEDYVTKVIEGCVQLGLAPSRQYALSVGTIDHLARQVVGLSLRPGALGRTFHTIDPQPLAWNVIFEQIREFGYPVRSVPFDQWRQALVERVEDDGDDNALAPLMAMIGETPDRNMPVIDTANVARLLPNDLAGPPLDAGYFRLMLGFFVRRQLLPPVTATITTGV